LADNNTKKSKGLLGKIVKVFLCLLLVLVIAVAALCYWQRDNISAFMKSRNSTSEDIAEEMSVSKAKTNEEIEKYNVPIKRDFTVEEEEQIRKGELSVEEAVSRLFQDEGTSQIQSDTSTGGTVANGNSDSTSESVNTSLTPEQEIISKYVTQIYSLKAEYIGKLGTFERELKSEYKAANGTSKNAAAIASFVQSNMGRVVSMESECDAKVDTLLTDMRSELTAIGADTSIVDTIEDAYIEEKALRKSYYLSLY
jgi:propanediol dehydratase large subunit